MLSLEDEGPARYFPRATLRVLSRLSEARGKLPGRVRDLLLSLPQIAEERRHRHMRRALMDLEEFLEDLLAYSGPRV